MKKFILIVTLLLSNIAFAKAEELTVILDWFANPNHAPLFVAKTQGYFLDENLNVDIIGPANPDDPPKLVAAGKGDIAITYQPQFMIQISQGLPLLRIGTLIATPLNTLTVLESSNIKTLADLKGKRIASSNSGIGELTLRTLLKKAVLTIDDVERINVHYDLTKALLTGKVDAATGLERNIELIQMKNLDKPGRAFYVEENGMPTYDEMIFVVNNKKRDDPRFPRFMRAVGKGTQYLINHPEETWLAFAIEHPELDNEFNHEAWMATLPRFALRPSALDTNRWNRFSAFLLNEHVIKELPPLNDYAAELNTR